MTQPAPTRALCYRPILMELHEILILCALFFGVAALYTTVGHAGASGYLAMMALVGIAPAVMRPTALVLNIVVAALTVYRFRKARFFNWSGLWPFLIGSVPFAALGGMQKLSTTGYYAAVGIVLLLSAVYLTWRRSIPARRWRKVSCACSGCPRHSSARSSACSRDSPAPGAASS